MKHKNDYGCNIIFYESWKKVDVRCVFVFAKSFKNSHFTHMCSNTWVVKFLKTHTFEYEEPFAISTLVLCMYYVLCRRARVKASNLAYYGNWGRSKSCTLTGCCRSWLLPQTTHDKYYFSQLCRSPFGVLMTYLTIQLLYVAAGIMYSIVVLRSLVNFFLNYKWNDSFPSYLKVKVTEYLLHDNLIEN